MSPMAVSQALLQWLQNFHEDVVRSPSGTEKVTLDEHTRLFDCIARHDPAGVEKAVRDHLTRAHELYRVAP